MNATGYLLKACYSLFDRDNLNTSAFLSMEEYGFDDRMHITEAWNNIQQNVRDDYVNQDHLPLALIESG